MNELPNPSKLTMRLRASIDDAVDGKELTPDKLAKVSREALPSIKILCGKRTYRLDEVFELEGSSAEQIDIHGDCRRIQSLGAGMTRGQLTIHGDVGNDVAIDLAGGQLEIFGNAGDRLGLGMRRGRIIVHGNVGDEAFGPTIGSPRGMRGGDGIILGNAGDRIGERMRRGTILVTGNAGTYGAVQMIAGTIVVLGRIGQNWAQGMRRGSIILTNDQPQAFSAELTAPREFELSFLPILWRYLTNMMPQTNVRLPQTRWARRQLGDRFNQGVGEILTLTRHHA